MRKFGYLSAVDEFETKGYVESSSHHNCYLIHRLRRQYGEYLGIFSVGRRVSAANKGAKFGAYEIFGGRIQYYYDIRREKEFVDFLEKEFYKKNPDPCEMIRRVFTRILHTHKLHWSRCQHRKDKSESESGEKNGKRRKGKRNQKNQRNQRNRN